MAYKKLEFANAISPADLRKGDVLEGVYLGSREVQIPGRGGDPGVIITLNGKDREGKKGPFDLWAPTSLRQILPQIPEGAGLRLTYLGQKKNPNTGREFHAFTVEVDTDLPTVGKVGKGTEVAVG